MSIIILNDTLVPNDKNYYNTYRIRNVETGVELTDVLEINLLELSKLPPEPDGSGLWKGPVTFSVKAALAGGHARRPLFKKRAHRFARRYWAGRSF